MDKAVLQAQHPQWGKNSPRYMGHIDDCIVSSCY